MIGFVYLIQNLNSGNYKIGITTKENIQERLKNIQTGSDGELLLIKKFKSPFYRKIEKKLHQKYNSKKTFGEWFSLTDQEVFSFLDDCNAFHQMFESLLSNPFFS